MNNKRYCLSLFAAIAWMAINVTGSAMAAQHEHGKEQIVKVGKNVEVTLAKETRVGDVTLKPGRYKLQHRVDGEDHFVHFTEWTATTYGGSGTPKTHPGEVKCRLEPLKEKVKQTAVFMVAEDGVQRISKVLVAGENVAHVF